MAKKIPAFTYTGESSAEMKGDTWYIYLKSSGTITFGYKKTLEVCVVGGGAGGEKRIAATTGLRTHGGGGGSVVNRSGITAAAGTGYSVVIGEGGAAGDVYGNVDGTGGASSAFGVEASGGVTPEEGQAYSDAGKDGTYAFGDSSLSRYGGGGGCGASSQGTEGFSGGDGGGGRGGGAATYGTAGTDAAAGAANTGGGGGGFGTSFTYKSDDNYKSFDGGKAAAGGSGIVILRGTEDDLLPVRFDGVQLSKILFNGEEVTGLVFGGTRLFARMLCRMRRAFEGRSCAYGV